MSSQFAAGDFAVWPGEGLVRVEGSREMNGKSFVVLKGIDQDITMSVPADQPLTSFVRAVVDRVEAERLVGVLRQLSGDPDPRPWAERHHHYMVTLLKRPLEAQVNALHTLYRAPYALSFGERRLTYTFERIVVGELAHALGRDLEALLVELKAGQPAFAPDQPPRPAELPVAEPKAPVSLKKHDYLGKISAPSGRIVVGEAAARREDTFLAEGKPGEWHAYVSEAEEGALVLIHADALSQYSKLKKSLTEIAELNVEGGTMAMIAAEARDDQKVQEAMIFPVGPIVEGSGCVVGTNGDGGHRLRGARLDNQLVALVVDF